MPQNQWNDADPFGGSSTGWNDANPFGQTQVPQFDTIRVDPNSFFGSPQVPQIVNQGYGQLPKPEPQSQGWFDYLTEPITRPLTTIASKAVEPWAKFMESAPSVPMTEIPSGYEDVPAQPAGPNDPYAQGIRFAGNMADATTSPLNLTLGGTGLIRNAALRGMSATASPARNALLSGTANVANQGLKAGSAFAAGTGAYDLFAPESSLTERALGATNLITGGLGYKAAKFFDPTPIPNKTALPGSAADDFFAGSPKPTGGTGSKPSTVVVSKPSEELIQSLLDEGYVPGPMNESGIPTMVLPTTESVTPEVTPSVEPAGEALIQPPKQTALDITKGIVDRLIKENNYTALENLVKSWEEKALNPSLSKEFNPGYFQKLAEYGRGQLASVQPEGMPSLEEQRAEVERNKANANFDELGMDVLSEIPLDEDIQASRILPMNITAEQTAREFARHSYPDVNTEKRIEFLINNGKFRQAYAVIQDMGIPKPVSEINQPVEGGRSIPIRQNYDIVKDAELLWTNPINERIQDQVEQYIMNETDPELIKENLNQLNQYVDYAKIHGDFDRKEVFGFLRDIALDKSRRPNAKYEIQEDPFNESNELIREADKTKPYRDEFFGPPPSSPDIFDIPPPVSMPTIEMEQFIFQNEKAIAQSVGWKNTFELRKELSALKRELPEAEYKLALQGIIDEFTNPTSSDEPQFARTKEGLIGTDINKDAAIQIITNLYEGEIGTIGTKELVQNALDAVEDLGSKGEVSVYFNHPENRVTVSDNGPGMTIDKIETVYTNIGESGKDASKSKGGFGAAKAVFQLGGKELEVVSTAKYPDGKLKTVHFMGTPEQFREQTIKPEIFDAQPGETTGTAVTLTIPQASNFATAREFMNNVGLYSGTGGKLKVFEKEYSWDTKPKETDVPNSLRGGKVPFATIDKENYNIQLLTPQDVNMHNSDNIKLIITNKGMYQGKSEIPLYDKYNVPEEIIVDVSSKVHALDKEYPFIPSRERLKNDVQYEVQQKIDDYFVKNIRERKKKEIGESYISMELGNVVGTVRKPLFLDSGNKLTDKELEKFTNNPVFTNLVHTIDNIIDEILQSVGRTTWTARVEGTGIILNPGLGGIHIPNPGHGRSSILINPFTKSPWKNPKDASLDIVVTALHEVAHVSPSWQLESDIAVNFKPEDLKHPGIGKYLASYMEEIMDQAGLDAGHGVAFVKRLGEIYAKYGPQRTIEATEAIESIISDGSGHYNGQFQELLRLYNESRGRDTVTEDALTGTGIKSTNRESSSKGNLSSNVKGSGGRTPAAVEFDRIIKQLQGGGKPPTETPTTDLEGGDEPPKLLDESGKPSKRRELWELSRGLMSSDLPYVTSAMLRQGAPLFGTSTWFKMWKDAAMAYHSEDLYKGIMDQIKKDPLFRNRINPKTKTEMPGTSFANEIGLLITDLSDYHKREEMIKSTWAERIPLYGRHVRKSNRAYTAALNAARWRQLNILVKGFKDAGRDPLTDLTLGQQLAEVINAQTGASQPKFRLPFNKEIDLTPYNKALADSLWSPRFLSSKIQQLNPFNYTQMEAPARKELLKSLFRRFAAWAVVTGGAAVLGAEIGNRITSSDFMKSRFGNIRLDPGAGLPQLMVLLARIVFGGSTSSIPPIRDQKFQESEKGFFANAGNRVMNFGENQLHPSAKYTWDIFNPNKYEPVHLIDRTMENILPLYMADAAEVWKEDPNLEGAVKAALMSILGSTGLASQTYDKGSFGKPKYINPGMDFEIK